MITKDKVTEIFCIANSVLNNFVKTHANLHQII